MEKIILAIETSCDETSMSIFKGHSLLSLKTVSQIDIHKEYGGVIPELASRLHVNQVAPILKEVVSKAKINIEDIDYICFTKEPGLVNALQIGLIVAKTIKMLIKKPLLAIDHLEGHLLSSFINEKDIEDKFPMLGVVISGGHTNIYYMKDSLTYKLMGKTLDDSIGESYDKVGKMLGIDYPAGSTIDKLTTNIKSDLKFSVPKVKGFDFSFSGIKSQVYREVSGTKKDKHVIYSKEQIINAFQEVVLKHFMEKIELASKEYNIKNITITGGVSASVVLRNKVNESKLFDNIYYPKKEFCSDNAAMIAYAGYNKIKNNKFEDANLNIDSSPKSNI
jgi:N6-L-threonylcarbamoyladenine synthase